jgi:hypothetical protein
MSPIKIGSPVRERAGFKLGQRVRVADAESTVTGEIVQLAPMAMTIRDESGREVRAAYPGEVQPGAPYRVVDADSFDA